MSGHAPASSGGGSGAAIEDRIFQGAKNLFEGLDKAGTRVSTAIENIYKKTRDSVALVLTEGVGGALLLPRPVQLLIDKTVTGVTGILPFNSIKGKEPMKYLMEAIDRKWAWLINEDPKREYSLKAWKSRVGDKWKKISDTKIFPDGSPASHSKHDAHNHHKPLETHLKGGHDAENKSSSGHAKEKSHGHGGSGSHKKDDGAHHPTEVPSTPHHPEPAHEESSHAEKNTKPNKATDDHAQHKDAR